MNLKWLSYPIFIYSLYALAKGIYNLSLSGSVDIGWVYGIVGIESLGYSIGSALFGGLVYLAFRNLSLTLRSK